ncbi:MAG: NAD(+)/NADH kinase [Hornefia sp.]|nr:NAD(+)/NADH kinase [Hornefia sp.]
MKKVISIYSNNKGTSPEIEAIVTEKLEKLGFKVTEGLCPNADLLVCIGGDGTFFDAIHKCKYPSIPIIGINTGHLGFFQDVSPDKIDEFIDCCISGNYTIQQLSLIKASVKTSHGEFAHCCLNETTIRSNNFRSIHLDIYVDEKIIECCNCDGMVLATPTGSTAFNYSLGGSIIDPRLDLIQITPIAPMNNTAYRTLSSSIILPSYAPLKLVPAMERDTSLCIIRDGYKNEYTDVREITISTSDKKINLIRSKDFDFWSKVNSKLL